MSTAMRRDEFDPSGADNISTSRRNRASQDVYHLEIVKARGIWAICRTCCRGCKVLKGSPGTRSKFICYSYEEESAR